MSDRPFASPFSKDALVMSIGKTTASLLGGGLSSGFSEKEEATQRSLKFDELLGASKPEPDAKTKAEPVVPGVSLSLVTNLDALCGALIGVGKDKFCLNLACDCKVASHSKAASLRFEAPPSSRFLVVRTSKMNAGFCTPVLDAAALDNKKVNDLLLKESPESGSWDIDFQAVVLDMEALEVSDLVNRTVKKAPRVKPEDGKGRDYLSQSVLAKIKSRVFDAPDDVDPYTWILPGKSAVSGEDEEAKNDAWLVLSDWSLALQGLSRSVNYSADLVNDISRGLEDTLPSMTHSIEALQEQFKGLWSAMNSVQNHLGKPANMSVAPSLWPAFSSFEENTRSSVNSLQQSITTMQVSVRKQGAELGSVITGATTFQSEMMEVLTDHTQALVTLNDKVTAVPKPAPRPSRFEALKVNPGLTSSSSNHGTGSRINNGSLESDQLMALVKDLGDRLSKLESTHTSQGGSPGQGQDIVVIGRDIFRDAGDTSGWITTHIGADLTSFNFGVFTDPLSLLQRINFSLSNATSSLKDVSIRASLNMTEGEHMMMQSLQCMVPRVFTGDVSKDKIFTGLGQSGKNQKSGEGRFKNCTTFKRWEDDNRQHGLKYQILTQLTNIRSEITTDINHLLHDKPDVRALATPLLSQSVSFIEHLCEFISDAYREINRSEATAVQSWDLVCFVVHQLFVTSFDKARRSVGSSVSNPTNRLSFGSHLLLATLRTVQVGVTLERTGLHNHPIVSASYTKFILSSVNAGEVRDLKDNVQALTTAIQDAVSGAKVAKQNADAAISTAKAAKVTADRAMAEAKKKG